MIYEGIGPIPRRTFRLARASILPREKPRVSRRARKKFPSSREPSRERETKTTESNDSLSQPFGRHRVPTRGRISLRGARDARMNLYWTRGELPPFRLLDAGTLYVCLYIYTHIYIYIRADAHAYRYARARLSYKNKYAREINFTRESLISRWRSALHARGDLKLELIGTLKLHADYRGGGGENA